jgi:hypothetical protein
MLSPAARMEVLPRLDGWLEECASHFRSASLNGMACSRSRCISSHEHPTQLLIPLSAIYLTMRFSIHFLRGPRFPQRLMMRLRHGDCAPAPITRTDSEFVGRRDHLHRPRCAFDPSAPYFHAESRTRRCGCADHHEVEFVVFTTRQARQRGCAG